LKYVGAKSIHWLDKKEQGATGVKPQLLTGTATGSDLETGNRFILKDYCGGKSNDGA